MAAECKPIARLLAAFVLLTGWSTAPWAAMDIQHWRTEQGARVYFVPAEELPMVDVRVVFDAGAARDGDQPGLAVLTNHMLMQGAGGLSADEIAARLEDVGASVGSGAERDMAWLTLRSLTDPELLGPALETLATVLGSPDFPGADLARERQRTLVALDKQRESPSEVAQQALYRAIYRDHPYAHEPLGTPESVRALTRDDLQAFYDRYYVARNAVVAIVGDLDRSAAEELAERLLAGLAAGEPAPPLPEVPPLTDPAQARIQHPSTQSHVRLGQPGIRRGAEDYYAVYVGNHALGGGGLVSLLMEEVREKRGLSYSVYSYFLPMARKGPFVLGMQTRNEQVDEGLQVLRDTLRAFVEDGISEEQLEQAKKNIIGGFPLRIDSNQEQAQYLAMIGFYELPLDYLDRFPERIEAVTREDVQRAFRERVQPERMAVVIVGGEP